LELGFGYYWRLVLQKEISQLAHKQLDYKEENFAIQYHTWRRLGVGHTQKQGIT
jgi:hypothetical protein